MRYERVRSELSYVEYSAFKCRQKSDTRSQATLRFPFPSAHVMPHHDAMKS